MDNIFLGGLKPMAKGHPVSDLIYESLKRNILQGSFPAGHKFDVEKLAKQFGVSKTPIYEVLNRLSLQGVVTIIPRKGTFVKQIPFDEIADILEVRKILEVAACTSILDCVKDEDIEYLAHLSELMNMPIISEEDLIEHDEYNRVFHEVFVGLSNNEVLLKIYRDLNTQINMTRISCFRGDWSTWGHRIKLESKEHKEIIRSLGQRDIRALQSSVEQHLDRTHKAIIEGVLSRTES